MPRKNRPTWVKNAIEEFKRNPPFIRLQNRDCDILKFLFEQKFSSLELIFFRFFDTRGDLKEPLPTNLWTARQRLAKLKKALLIKTEKVLSSGKSHYLITHLGAGILNARGKIPDNIKPTPKIDFSLYDHDLKISTVRVVMERRKKSQIWWPEKILRRSPIPIRKDHFSSNQSEFSHSTQEEEFSFSKDLIPDAVFINSKGERVALELEVSRKGPSKVLDKLRLYDDMIESKILDKVWIIATRASIERCYRKVINQSFRKEDAVNFRVDSYDNVVEEISHSEQ